MLIAFRGLQGVGAAILIPSTLAILAPTFPDPRERAAAIGIWSGVSGIALGAGPLIGGLLVNSGNWRTVFYINVPIGIVAFVVATRILPESRGSRTGIDLGGQVSVLVGLGSVTFALIDGETRGWTSPLIVGSLIVGGLALAAFIVIERRVRQPMLQLSMFRSQTIASAHVVRALLGFAFFGILFFGSLYFQDVLGYSPLQAGVRWLPMTAAVALGAPFAGRLSGVIGPRLIVTTGMAVAAVGMFLFSTATVTSEYGSFWWHMVLVGLGLGMCLAPLTAVVVNTVAPDQVEMGSSSIVAAQQTGSVFGVAVLGVVVTSRMDAVVRAGINTLALSDAQKSALLGSVSQHALSVGAVPSGDAGAGLLVKQGFVDGMQAGMRISGVVLAVGAGLALRFLPGIRRHPVRSSRQADAIDVESTSRRSAI